MRNLKKVMAAAIAAAMLAGMTVTAFADVPSVKATEGAKVESASETEDGGYIVEDLGEHFAEEMKDAAQEDLDAIAAANEAGASEAGVKAFTDALAKSSTDGKDEVIAALKDKKFLTTFFDVYAWGNAKTEDVDVTLKVDGLGDYKSDEVTFVHFNVSTGKWEVLKNVKIDGDQITVHFDSFSPTSIAVVTKKSAEPTPTKAPASTGTKTSSGSTSSSSTSPKTGMESNWMLYAAAALLLAVCAAFVSRRERA